MPLEAPLRFVAGATVQARRDLVPEAARTERSEGDPPKRKRFGLIVRVEDYGYQQGLIAGAASECERLEADLYCFSGRRLRDTGAANSLYRLAPQIRLDGVILSLGTLGCSPEEPAAKALLDAFHPTPVCVIGPAPPGHRSVGVDDSEATRQAVRHLVQHHQRRRIAFVGAPGAEANARRIGYEQALQEAGLAVDPRLVSQGDFSRSSGESAIRKLLADWAPADIPDGLVCANDWMALGALAALERAGIPVPQRVAVIGFDDVEEARACSPPLTTVRQSAAAIGREAVCVLAEGGERRILPTQLEVRRSCGCGAAAPVRPRPRSSSDEALLSALGGHRSEWIASLQEAFPFGVEETPSDFAEALVDALLLDLQEGAQKNFVACAERMARAAAARGRAAVWHQIVSHLRQESLESLSGVDETWLRAVTVFEGAQVAISAQAELCHTQRRLKRQDMLHSLYALGTSLQTALDHDSIRSALLHLAPKVGLERLFVCLRSARDGAGELLVQYPTPEPQGDLRTTHTLPASELFPPELGPQARHSLLIQPLYTEESCLGYCAMDLVGQDPALSQFLPGLVSSTLKAVTLSQALLAEAARRRNAEHARMRDEMRIAAEIQAAILPSTPAIRGLEIATAMMPATEVGGDYFDLLPVKGGGWLGIGDVAGHGLHSGLVMLMIQSIVATNVAAMPRAAPAELWGRTNRILCHNVRERLRRSEHATLSLVRYQEGGQLSAWGAHEEVIVLRASAARCELFDPPGIWAGIRADADTDASQALELTLSPGDLFVLHTDGATEAQNEQREQFGMERLLAAIERHRAAPAEQLVRCLLAELQDWTHQQTDDLTLVVARYAGPSESSPPVAD